MSRVAAIGEEVRLAGFALAGVAVCGAVDAAAARAAWERLPDDVSVLIVTARAAAALAPSLPERPHVLWAVMPD